MDCEIATSGSGSKPLKDLENTLSDGFYLRGRGEILVKEWENPWDHIYIEYGVPKDLQHPYYNFDYILDMIDSLEQPRSRGEKRVLDVAMGPGRHAIALARRGYEVYGFDLSQKALDLAEQELQIQGLKCDMRVADMFGDYPYEDSFFDAVVAIQAIYHGYPPHMERAIKEIRRILLPGGLFAFTVSRDCERAMADTDGLKKRKGALKERDFIQVEGYEDTYVFRKGREAGLPHYYPNELAIEQMLTNASFNNIQHFKDVERMYRVVWCNAI